MSSKISKRVKHSMNMASKSHEHLFQPYLVLGSSMYQHIWDFPSGSFLCSLALHSQLFCCGQFMGVSHPMLFCYTEVILICQPFLDTDVALLLLIRCTVYLLLGIYYVSNYHILVYILSPWLHRNDLALLYLHRLL